MLMIRLQRVGRKNDPSFRTVVTDSKNSTKSGKFLEVVGAYDPRKQSGKIQLNADRIKYWLSVGAKATDTVHNLLIAKKIITGDKVNMVPVKPAKAEPAKVETPAETAKVPEAEAAKEEAPAETFEATVTEETTPKEIATEPTAAEVVEEIVDAPTVSEEAMAETPTEETTA
jgi:small subunit ribosomal protein S16